MGIINSLGVKEESCALSSDEIHQRIVGKDDWAKITLMEEITLSITFFGGHQARM